MLLVLYGCTPYYFHGIMTIFMIVFNTTATHPFSFSLPRQVASSASDTETKSVSETKEASSNGDNFTKASANSTVETNTEIVKPTMQQNVWWRGLTGTAAGLIGSVLGAIGGYKVTELLHPEAATTATESMVVSNPLEMAKQQALYYVPHPTNAITTPQLPKNLISGYYEFIPQSVLTPSLENALVVQYHLPNQTGSITYTFNTSAVESSNVTGVTGSVSQSAAKPHLSIIDTHSANGYSQQLRLDAQGRVVSKVEVRPNAEGIVQSHEWRYQYQDTHNINTHYAVFNGLEDAATCQQETVYQQVLDAKTNAVKEVSVLTNTGQGERIRFNTQTGEAVERFVAQTAQPDTSKFSTLKALILKETPVEETVETTSKNKLKQVMQTVGEGVGNFINRLNPNGFNTTEDVAKRFSTMAEVQAANPIIALQESRLGALIPTDGDAILQSLQKSWRTYEANFNPNQAFNWKQLKQAFASTTTGQRIGLALGAVVGGTLSVLALVHPWGKQQPSTTTTEGT
jgi:hypothetical protein